MMRIKLNLAMTAIPLLIVTTGCQHLSTDAAFADVRSDVSLRLNKDVRWNRNDGAGCAEPGRDLSKELSVNDAVQIALLNNRSLQAEFENIGIAQAELQQAGRMKNPRLDANLRPSLAKGPATTAGLDLAVNFLDLIFIPLRQKVAAARFDAAKARVTVAVLRLAGKTQSAFYKHQAAVQMLELRKSVVQATDASAYAAEQQRKVGNIAKLDLNRERDQNDQAKLDLSEAEAMVLETKEALNESMGLWGTDAAAWKIAGRLPDLPAQEADLNDFEKRAIEHSAELEASRRTTDALAREYKVTNISSVLSSAEVGISAAREDDKVWHVGPSLSLELPIFDQGGPRKEKARAEIRKAIEEHAALAVSLRASVRIASARLSKARQQSIFIRDQILPRRQEILDETQKEYNGMQVGVFQLLQAKRDQIDAGRQFIERLRDYWLARSGVDLIGIGFTDMGTGSSAMSGN
jgi:cobalt-zinc-cadmium efflux system outer membrane protein